MAIVAVPKLKINAESSSSIHFARLQQWMLESLSELYAWALRIDDYCCILYMKMQKKRKVNN